MPTTSTPWPSMVCDRSSTCPVQAEHSQRAAGRERRIRPTVRTIFNRECQCSQIHVHDTRLNPWMRGTPYARTSAPNIMTGTFKPIAAPDTRMTSPMTQTMSCALSRPRITRVADSRLNDAAGTCSGRHWIRYRTWKPPSDYRLSEKQWREPAWGRAQDGGFLRYYGHTAACR